MATTAPSAPGDTEGETPAPRRRALFRVAQLAGAALLPVCLVVWQHLADWPGAVTLVLAAAALALWWRTRRRLLVPAVVAAAALLALIWLLTLRPANDREWAPGVSVLPTVTIAGDRVHLRNLRDFRWGEDGIAEARWTERHLNLADLRELELVVEPFRDSELMAHTMLCFGFGDERIIVSVEARKEQGETYGLVAGALRQFELMYVFGTERDLLTLRAVTRQTRLYLYPIRAEPDFIRALFLDLAASANDLHQQPRFYRSIRDNCTTTLVQHFDRHLEDRIGLQPDTLFPARTGRLLHRRGFMRTDLGYDQAHRHCRIDERVRQHAADPAFSRLLRGLAVPETSPPP